jgi:hypothetical protein
VPLVVLHGLATINAFHLTAQITLFNPAAPAIASAPPYLESAASSSWSCGCCNSSNSVELMTVASFQAHISKCGSLKHGTHNLMSGSYCSSWVWAKRMIATRDSLLIRSRLWRQMQSWRLKLLHKIRHSTRYTRCKNTQASWMMICNSHVKSAAAADGDDNNMQSDGKDYCFR